MTPASEEPKIRKPIWHWIYYALALIDVLTITAALSLSHHLMGIYEETVNVNKDLSQQTSELIQLGFYAATLSEPGNRVFESKDSALERRRLLDSKTQFDRALEKASTKLPERIHPESKTRIQALYKNILLSSQHLYDEAQRVFDAWDQQQLDLATKAMSRMDNQHYQLNRAIGDITQLVTDNQNYYLLLQLAQAQKLKKYEQLIAASMILIIVLVLIYGYTLGKRMRRDQDVMLGALSQAERSSRVKAAFLANMSHEIRTPLNGMVGIMDMLGKTRLNDVQQHYVTLAKTSTSQLWTVINDVLDYSRLDDDNMTLESTDFDLNELISQQIEAFALVSEAKGLALVMDTSGLETSVARGDPERLKQILANLIDNAIKFTAHGEVVVTARSALTSDGDFQLDCAVRDTGIGISEKHLDHLFTEFSQADISTTRKYGGSGLGLSISKRLCELMHGSIAASGQPGQGSEFRFTVRLAQAELKVAELPPIPFEGKSLLLIDDSVSNRQALQNQLRKWGLQDLHAATSMESARAVAYSLMHGPEIIMINLELSSTDGVSLLQDLIAIPRLKNSHYILMIPMQRLEEKDQFLAAGFDAVLARPITYRSLYSCLSQVMQAWNFETEGGPEIMPATSAKAGLGLSVMLVEDNAVNRIVVESLLEEFGCATVNAENGAEALEQLKLYSIDLILMDCQMPVMDGFTATRAIRRGEAGQHNVRIPIIALTANVMPEDKQACKDAGMDRYLKKPIDTEQLYQELLAFVRPPLLLGGS